MAKIEEDRKNKAFNVLRQNIQRILDQKGLKQVDLAKMMNVTDNYISQLIKGHASLSENTLTRIAMLLDVDELEFIKTPDIMRFEDEHAMIPLYKIDVAAGLDGIANGDYPEREMDLPFKRSWLESKGYKGTRIDDLILMRAKGESMEPTISNGEVLLVDIGESVRTPESIEKGRVYVVRWGITKDDISVKRLFLDLPRKIAIAVSDNPLFKQVDVDLREYEKFQDFVLGKVIWVGKENI